MGLDLLSRVLYRDGLVVVLDKPAGWAVHGGPSGRPALADHFDQLRFGLPRLPELAHRLDAGTSGCLVLGRHPKALRRLGRIFSGGLVGKTYLALTEGLPPGEAGEIDAPLRKVSIPGGGWHVCVDPAGKPALTAWRLLGRVGDRGVIAAFPKTGRTHQIRVHLAHAGCPILGDRRYGGSGAGGGQMYLHATRISLPVYPGREPVRVSAPLPEHFRSHLGDADIDLGSAKSGSRKPVLPSIR